MTPKLLNKKTRKLVVIGVDNFYAGNCSAENSSLLTVSSAQNLLRLNSNLLKLSGVDFEQSWKSFSAQNLLRLNSTPLKLRSAQNQLCSKSSLLEISSAQNQLCSKSAILEISSARSQLRSNSALLKISSTQSMQFKSKLRSTLLHSNFTLL